MKIKTLLLPISLLLIITACSEAGIKGNEKVVTNQRQLQNFNKIKISGKYNLLLSTDTTQKVNVTADSNLQSYILTKIDGDTLSIYTKDNINLITRTTPSISIQAPQLTTVQTSGNIHVKGTQITGKALSIHGSGASHITLDGKVDALNIKVSGAANINTTALQADVVKIDISGSGKAKIYAKQKLDVNISGSGDVRYMGNPEIQQLISGHGRITPLKSQD